MLQGTYSTLHVDFKLTKCSFPHEVHWPCSPKTTTCFILQREENSELNQKKKGNIFYKNTYSCFLKLWSLLLFHSEYIHVYHILILNVLKPLLNMLAEFAFGFSPSTLYHVSPFLRILNPSFIWIWKVNTVHACQSAGHIEWRKLLVILNDWNSVCNTSRM